MDWCSFLSSRWGVFLYFLILTLLALLALNFFNHNKRTRIFTPGNVSFVGIFISAFAYFIPLYLLKGFDVFPAILASFQHSFRIFGLDGGFTEFIATESYPAEIEELYISFGAVLYAVAPLLTFGFILTFFKNFFSHLKYKGCFWTETHIFSELNEKSLALAKSLHKKSKPFLRFIPRSLFVFTDIIDKKEELSLDLIEEAKEIGAILFRKDLESVHFKRANSCRKVNFYLISNDEAEKIRHAESIIENYDYEGVGLWIFSDDIRTELILAKNDVKNMSLTRVNDVQSLIYHNLDKNGINLFKRARKTDGEKDVISAVIIGLGKYGQEMLKALTWFCQLEDYKLKISAFDADEKAEEKLKAMCPELMSDKYNKKFIFGEPYYEITIHSGVDVAVPQFEELLSKIDDATYIFVCLGNDEANLSAATEIRTICERINYSGDGRKPDIETIIYDSNVRKSLGITWDNVENSGKEKLGAANYKKQPYNILMTGDLDTFYSEETVINSDLVADGFAAHTDYCVDYKKVSFAEDTMTDEWNEFIVAEGLKESWDVYFALLVKDGKKALKFPESKSGFSFMTIKEEKAVNNGVTEEEFLKLKNTATERIDKWEKLVYAKFNHLITDPEIEKLWTEIEKSEKKKATESFRFEYNFRSSITKAIHKRLRKNLKYKSEITDKAWEDMTLQDKVEIGKIEHVRWNAYMRTEGYSYSEKRNDLARLHHNLVPVTELSNDDLRKDA
ncbi:MAG: hypothetical protein IKL74_01065 [Clostridia bacterium]|nr:hypothetical protein [Clostridia bacterium]